MHEGASDDRGVEGCPVAVVPFSRTLCNRQGPPVAGADIRDGRRHDVVGPGAAAAEGWSYAFGYTGSNHRKMPPSMWMDSQKLDLELRSGSSAKGCLGCDLPRRALLLRAEDERGVGTDERANGQTMAGLMGRGRGNVRRARTHHWATHCTGTLGTIRPIRTHSQQHPRHSLVRAVSAVGGAECERRGAEPQGVCEGAGGEGRAGWYL